MSTKAREPVSLANYPNKNVNLPRLQRIILRNANRNNKEHHEEPKKYEPISIKPHQVDISNMLKIEGKGRMDSKASRGGIRHDEEYDMAKKNADKDIRKELRKIYNLKPSPKKPSRRIVELPRIH